MKHFWKRPALAPSPPPRDEERGVWRHSLQIILGWGLALCVFAAGAFDAASWLATRLGR